MNLVKSKSNLLVICYPLDWHWALSFEFLNHQNKLGLDYEVLDLSYVGENGIRRLIRSILGGSKLQKAILKNWKDKKVLVSKKKQIWYDYFARKSNGYSELYEVDLASVKEAFNSIVERVGNLKPDVGSDSKIIKQEIFAREKIRLELSSINPSNYSTVVTVNGRFTKSAVVTTWAKVNNVPISYIEFGSSAKKFEVYKRSPQSVEEIEFKINELWNSSNQITRELNAENYLNKIIKNSGLSEIDWRSSMKQGEVPEKGTKKICTFFASTELEYVGVGDQIPQENFQNQVEAFKGLVALLDKDDWDIYLRMHPNNPKNKIQGAESFIWDDFKEFNHITIIESDSSIDSLELGKNSDLVASFGSNIAMEFVARGLSKVLTLGPAPWNKLLPNLFRPNSNLLTSYLNSDNEYTNVQSIFPWAFFVSTYGIDFEFLKFDKDSSKWCF